MITNQAWVFFLVSVLAGALGTVKTLAVVSLRPVVAGLLSSCWALLVLEGLRDVLKSPHMFLECSAGYGVGVLFAVMAKKWR